jgi:phage-related protein (TIGR01555 family)
MVARYIPKRKKAKPTRQDLSFAYDQAIARAGPSRNASQSVQTFQFPAHPPRLMRAVKAAKMAMDDNSGFNSDFSWASSVIGQSFHEGLQFLGYPYLAQLAQRPEYRIPVETIAGEMCRKWIKFEAVGKADKGKEIKELEDKWKELEVQDRCRTLIEQDGYFGRSHLHLDFGSKDDANELRMPIGDGQNKISRAKVKRGSLKRLTTVEAIWAYPTNYNSNDPLAPDWYNPQHWFVMGKELHVSRFLTFVGREVPDILKPAYSFGGLSLSQIMKPYVDNWLITRQSVNDLIHAFVVWGLKTNLAESLMEGGDLLFKRAELFNRFRDNRGIMLTDKDTEEFTNTVAPLGTLDALQAQAQEHMMSVARIPAVKFTGLQPTGLNASSEGEIRAFYDTIHDRQETFLRKNLTRLMHFTMLDLWGQVDPAITFAFEPLWSMDEKEHSEVGEVQARTDQIYVDMGVISQEEVRIRLADDAESPYQGLDKTTMPDLKGEIEAGLIPKGGGGGVKAELGEGEEPAETVAGASERDEGENPEDGSEDALGGLEPDLDGSEPDMSHRTARTGKLVRLMHSQPKPHPERAERMTKLKKLLPSEAAE